MIPLPTNSPRGRVHMKKLALVALSVLALGSISQAETADFQKLGFSSQTEMQNYFNVVDVKVTEGAADIHQFNAPAPVNPTLALGGGFLDALGPVLMDPSGVSGWIAFGKK